MPLNRVGNVTTFPEEPAITAMEGLETIFQLLRHRGAANRLDFSREDTQVIWTLNGITTAVVELQYKPDHTLGYKLVLVERPHLLQRPAVRNSFS